MKLSAVFGALRSHRDSLQKLDAEIATLERQRGELMALPPDRKAVIAWALRAVDRAEADFADHLRSWYLAKENVGHVAGAWFDHNPGPLWLETQQRCPGVIEESHEGQMAGFVDLDRKAIMALLAPQLRELIPQWIEKSFPFQTGALSSEERKSRIAAIDKKLADLFRQRDEYASELSQASSEIREMLPE